MFNYCSLMKNLQTTWVLVTNMPVQRMSCKKRNCLKISGTLVHMVLTVCELMINNTLTNSIKSGIFRYLGIDYI